MKSHTCLWLVYRRRRYDDAATCFVHRIDRPTDPLTRPAPVLRNGVINIYFFLNTRTRDPLKRVMISYTILLFIGVHYPFSCARSFALSITPGLRLFTSRKTNVPERRRDVCTRTRLRARRGQINGRGTKVAGAADINETRSYHVICHVVAICLSFEIVVSRAAPRLQKKTRSHIYMYIIRYNQNIIIVKIYRRREKRCG